MAQLFIDVGLGELTGDGETLRSAFIKINKNFNELYEAVGVACVIGEEPPTEAEDSSFFFSTITAKLYIKHDGQWVEPARVTSVQGDDVTGSGSVTIVSPTPPADPVEGTVWLNEDNARLYISANGQWVQPAITGGGAFIEANTPPYTPQFPEHWEDPKPTTQAEALDRIVQVLYQMTSQKV
jgi:hypothetical protein